MRALEVDARGVRSCEADQIRLRMAGLGFAPPGPAPRARAPAGDRIAVSALVGAFSAPLPSVRAQVGHQGVVSAACVQLTGLRTQVRDTIPAESLTAVRALGRGGLAGVAHALAAEGGLGLRVDGDALPVPYHVQIALAQLAVEPVCAATTGCVWRIVAAGTVGRVLAVPCGHRPGRAAAVVGEVVHPGVDAIRRGLRDGRPVPLRADHGPPARLA